MSSEEITLDVQDVFESAHSDGDLSTRSLQSLTVDADIGVQIQAGLGIACDDVPASEVVLVTMMPDDSHSIRAAGNVKTVREGHNMVLEALAGSSQASEVLVHTRYLNGHVLFPYRPLADAVRMTTRNYKPTLGTPLYDQTAVLLGTVLAKAWEFEDNGVPVRTVTLIITDGDDVCSTRQTPAAVRAIVEDMQRSECHVIAAMGINDGSTDFRRVFHEMGIPDEWILTPGNSEAEIRSAFQVFSQSAVAVSQQAATVPPVAAGGFAI